MANLPSNVAQFLAGKRFAVAGVSRQPQQAANAVFRKLLSAGFDAHAKDPIGSLGLDTEDFVTLTKQVLDIAKPHAKGRLVQGPKDAACA